MVRIFRSILRFAVSVIVVAFTIVGFVPYKGAQPMQVSNAAGLTFWRFVGERVAVISELSPKCRQLHLGGYALTVPIYPKVYTLVGLSPNSYLASHTQPDPLIPSRVSWLEALVGQCWHTLVAHQQSNTDQQMSFRNR
jgi:hypothetical protein